MRKMSSMVVFAIMAILIATGFIYYSSTHNYTPEQQLNFIRPTPAPIEEPLPLDVNEGSNSSDYGQ